MRFTESKIDGKSSADRRNVALRALDALRYRRPKNARTAEARTDTALLGDDPMLWSRTGAGAAEAPKPVSASETRSALRRAAARAARLLGGRG